MAYGKYFSKGQKVFITRVPKDEEIKTLDTLTGYATNSSAMELDLTLPYGSDAAESYPFEPEMPFEVMTDHKGMGLRLRARFKERTSSKDIRLQIDGNLEFISRRMYRRLDVNAWVGYRREAARLAEMRKLWQDSLEKIESGVDPREFTNFQKYPVNLSGGGLRLPVKAPAENAELMLLFLSIGDKQGIICALSEIVCVGNPDHEGMIPVGLRFLNIREKDQTRIDTVVSQYLSKLEQSG